MKVIDAWMQHPSEHFFTYPYFDSLKRWLKQDFKKIPLEDTLRVLDSAQVEKALISAWHGPEGPMISNEEVLSITMKYPDRFFGVAAVDIRDTESAISTIRKYVLEHHFKALRVIQWLWELPCTHSYYQPLLEECVNLNIPVCLQVGLTGPLKTSETGRPGYIEKIALDHPQLKIVCGHIGYPWHIEMIAYATKFPNVYIDTSAYKSSRYPAELVQYIYAHGASKVMFGSNYPMITPGDCLQDLDSLGLRAENQEMFLYKNAEAVFDL